MLVWSACEVSENPRNPTPDVGSEVATAIAEALPTATPSPTPDIDATIEAGIAATSAAMALPVSKPTPAPTPIQATPLNVLPTPIPKPLPTHTPTPTYTPVPTPTPHPCSLVRLARFLAADPYARSVSLQAREILETLFPDIAAAYILETIGNPTGYASFRRYLGEVGYAARNADLKAGIEALQS